MFQFIYYYSKQYSKSTETFASSLQLEHELLSLMMCSKYYACLVHRDYEWLYYWWIFIVEPNLILSSRLIKVDQKIRAVQKDLLILHPIQKF